MSKKSRKRTTGKTTSNIQALDDEALKGIVGGRLAWNRHPRPRPLAQRCPDQRAGRGSEAAA